MAAEAGPKAAAVTGVSAEPGAPSAIGMRGRMLEKGRAADASAGGRGMLAASPVAARRCQGSAAPLVNSRQRWRRRLTGGQADADNPSRTSVNSSNATRFVPKISELLNDEVFAISGHDRHVTAANNDLAVALHQQLQVRLRRDSRPK